MIAHLGLDGYLYLSPSNSTRPVLALDPDNAEDMAAFAKELRVRVLVNAHDVENTVRSLLPKTTPPEPGMAARVTAGGMQWARSTTGWWWPLTDRDSRGYDWEDLYAKCPDLTIEGGDES